MSLNVYSHRFLEELGLNGTRTITVDAGYTAVIRDIRVYASNGGLSPIVWYLQGTLGQSLDWFSVDPAETGIHFWTGRQVFYSGESIAAVTTGAMDVTISGYLLVNP